MRIVNFTGLAVITAGMLISFSFLRKEMSYDRHHKNADRIVRLSFRYEDSELDGRIAGLARNNPLYEDCAALEEAALLRRINTALLEYEDKSKVINNSVLVTPGFFRMFDLRWREGGTDAAPDREGRVAISESLARELFGGEPALGRELKVSSRQLEARTLFVSGVYENMPAAAHFHTDLIGYRAENDSEGYAYTYLMLNRGTGLEEAGAELAAAVARLYADAPRKPQPELMPLTDIHLRGRALRELEPNGNITYIYLVAGANALLLLIVMFNLWLNAGLIFARNRRFYCLLRLNGASARHVISLEARLGAVLAVASVMAGGCLAAISATRLGMDIGVIAAKEWAVLCLGMVVAIVGVSLWPVIGAMSSTLFLNRKIEGNDFSLGKVKYMLIAQYAMVMFIVILSFGISRQTGSIRKLQVGADSPGLLVMREQADVIQEKYELLRAELLRHPEIEAVTAAMQLPGTAVRDAMSFKRHEQADEEAVMLPIMIVGDGFLPFFRIEPIAGNGFTTVSRTYEADLNLLMARMENDAEPADLSEEYVINRKAAAALGFASAEDAVGKQLRIVGPTIVGYIAKGVVAGVTEDFTYATTYEDTFPMVMLSRKFFLHCIMVRFAANRSAEGLSTFKRVWGEIIPDYPADYSFLGEVYDGVYANEWHAEALVRLFSALSLIVANLGLVIIMAFLVKRKTREIGIRKVHGAGPADIIRLLNGRLTVWIGLAFLLGAPPAYLVMERWLSGFAQKISLEWWLFALAGISVLAVAFVSVLVQCLRAARLNPVAAIGSN